MCHIKSAQELLLLNVFDEDDLRHERRLGYHFPTHFLSAEDVEDERRDFRDFLDEHDVDTGTHPECRVDEAFLGNVSPHLYAALLWKTKRAGRVAYSSRLRPLKNGLHPLFVEIHELIEAGLKPECVG